LAHPLASRRVLDEALTVPDDVSGVKPVPQDTGLTSRVSKNERRGPFSAPWTSNTLAIKLARDGSRGSSVQVVGEDFLIEAASTGSIARFPVTAAPEAGKQRAKLSRFWG
jgi:hypothetical protein